MDKSKQLDRRELIQRRGRRGGGGKKFCLITKWDPRAANVREGLAKFENMLYRNEENRRLFPQGSIIPGFRRQKNLGEIAQLSQTKTKLLR